MSKHNADGTTDDYYDAIPSDGSGVAQQEHNHAPEHSAGCPFCN